jgi:hypothetical protein
MKDRIRGPRTCTSPTRASKLAAYVDETELADRASAASELSKRRRRHYCEARA